jgi:hypothetical protein
MDLETLKITKIESDPKNKVDFGGLSTSDLTRKIISTSYTDDKTTYYWQDKSFYLANNRWFYHLYMK